MPKCAVGYAKLMSGRPPITLKECRNGLLYTPCIKIAKLFIYAYPNPSM